jgi:hypothetical protein
MNMPAHKGVRANAKEINRLIEERGGLLKALVIPSRRKTLDRARKGESMKLESLQYLANIFEVDVSDILIDEDRSLTYQRFVSLKFIRTESLKGFPKDFFEITDWNDTDLLMPFEVEAKFEIDDPTEEQAETAAQLVDSVEAMINPQKASAMIRAKGKLNSTIKKLAELGIYLYVGSYKHRQRVLPFIDADQSEITLCVIPNRLLLIFTESRKSRAIQRQVDQGMSLDALKEEEYCVYGQLEKEKRDALDEEEIRYLNKMREDAKNTLVDCSI